MCPLPIWLYSVYVPSKPPFVAPVPSVVAPVVVPDVNGKSDNSIAARIRLALQEKKEKEKKSCTKEVSQQTYIYFNDLFVHFFHQ